MGNYWNYSTSYITTELQLLLPVYIYKGEH